MNEQTMTPEQFALYNKKIAEKDLTSILCELTNIIGWDNSDRHVLAYNKAFDALLNWKYDIRT